jgi:ABC-type amino acid transport substrate-binding protein
MIFIAAAFTAHVVAKRFTRSWVLWYFVKPFTAAGLALAIYLVFRAGLLSTGDNAAGINPFGVVGLAMLTGLFTDAATKKLRDIFSDAVKPKKDSPEEITDDEGEVVADAPTFTSISPSDKLTKGQTNDITIAGSNFDKQELLIVLGDQRITGMTITPTEIKFSSDIPADITTSAIVLAITDKIGKTLYAKKFQL